MGPLQPAAGGGAAVDQDETFDKFRTTSRQPDKHICSKANAKTWSLMKRQITISSWLCSRNHYIGKMIPLQQHFATLRIDNL